MILFSDNFYGLIAYEGDLIIKPNCPDKRFFSSVDKHEDQQYISAPTFLQV